MAATNTSLAAAMGACSSLFVNLWWQERRTGEYTFDLTKAMNGCLSGLVAVTAGCGTVENWAGATIGIVAGLIYLGGSDFLIRLKIDDAVDAIPVHMFNGIWGIIATGLFSSPGRIFDAYGTDEHAGWFYEVGRGSINGTLFTNQLLCLVFILGWVVVTMLPFFLWLNYMGWFRSDSLEELVGLDLSYMGNNANLSAASQHSEDFSQPDNASEGEGDMRRNKRSFTNMDHSDAASWTEMSANPKEQSRAK